MPKYPLPPPQVLAFSPESSMSPPRQEDSEDDESSFMTHTQVRQGGKVIVASCHCSGNALHLADGCDVCSCDV